MGDMDSICCDREFKHLSDDEIQVCLYVIDQIVKTIPYKSPEIILPILKRTNIFPKKIQEHINENKGTMPQDNYLMNHMLVSTRLPGYYI